MNNVKIKYKDIGHGKPVVLLHGFCGSAAYWEELVPLLAENYRCIVPDLRGHGESPAPQAEKYTMEQLADDLAILLEELQLEQAYVFGHSLGGYVTLSLAERYAERLAGFGLIHSTAYPDDEKGKVSRAGAMNTIRDKGLNAFLEGLVPRLFSPQHTVSKADKVNRAKEIGQGTNPNAAISTIAGMRDRPDRCHVLEQTLIPVLLVAGTEDQIISQEKVFSVSGEHIEQQVIEGAGHMSMLENPHELAAVLHGFLK